jgi:hypothetical protein
VLRADLLHCWAHWITPEWSSRRFDTRFFVASVPAGQQARDVGGEADHVAWLPVEDAFAAYRNGTLTMMTPTASTLRDLSEHRGESSVLAVERRVRPIMTRPVVVNGDVQIIYDTEHGPRAAAGLLEPSPDRGVGMTTPFCPTVML